MQEISQLAELGWDSWFETHAGDCSARTIARIATVDRDQLLLLQPSGIFRARLAGSFLYHNPLNEQHPCVGDWVCVEKNNDDDYSLIHSVIVRKTYLRRKSAGDTIGHQMIAANIDIVFVVQSCHFDFNLKRLERYLVMIRDGGAEPYILLTKTDLVDSETLNEQVSAIHDAGISVPVATLSNITQEGIDDIKSLLKPGKTYCFVGSSGVGKSTLINHLTGNNNQQTQDVSGTGEGRHTTVRRELVILDNGSLVIDNPGMREFGILASEESIDESFSDISALASLCRYRDCSHTSEPHCAVIEALQSGKISHQHYDNFLKLKNESAFYEMSYAEKRKKDRDLGKFYKSAKKQTKARKNRD